MRSVPSYDIVELAPRRTRYCLAVPVINEGERIARQMQKMAAMSVDVDVVIADGGSTDGSVDEERLSGVRARLTKTGPGKLGAQIRMAFDWCLDEGYHGVILIDGNDKDEPAETQRFLDALDAGYDFVQGSRFLDGGRHVNNPTERLLGVKLIHAPLISAVSGFRFTDTTNGFRGYSRSFLLDPAAGVFQDRLVGYELHYVLSIQAATLGYRVCEVPVTRTYPKGEVPSKIGGWRGNVGVMRELLLACAGVYRP